MKTIMFVCHDCRFEYEITFDELEFHEPIYCAGCGNDDFLGTMVKEGTE